VVDVAAKRERDERIREGGAAADPGLWRNNPMFTNGPHRTDLPGWVRGMAEGHRFAMMTDYEPPHPRALDAGQVEAIKAVWTDKRIEGPRGTDPAPGLPRAQLDLPAFTVESPNLAISPLAPVVDAALAANEFWWQFEITTVKGYMRLYRPGDGHRLHADLVVTPPAPSSASPCN
jgi:hypothetical protein